ncbi:hypothetical protein [Krasilnikovia sp. MM14-A1259]|uniref:hypothetical protein n=1 Tax=Krasilnikovia sp. MM14-A1259 TaxID=3373539 RepID=UPI00380C3496
MPPNLVELLKSLGLRSSSDLFAQSVGRLGHSFEAVRQLQAHPTRFIDVSFARGDEVRSWLSALVAGEPPSVLVVWLADRTAAEMPFPVLLERYDDLWYPSMDDVAVIFPDGGLLLMDHEERFCFGRVVTAA